MQSSLSTNMEFVSDYILMRRPAIPRKWDSVSKPHVAVIIDEPLTGQRVRYYLSQIGAPELDGNEGFDIVDLDVLAKELPAGSLLEVRFSATNANLYRLENCGCVPCWRWIGKYRGIQAFEFPSPIDWDEMISESRSANVHDVT